MDPLFLIFLVIISLMVALMAITFAMATMKMNRKQMQYIEEHKEKVVVLEKIAGNSKGEKKEYPGYYNEKLRLYIKIRLRDGSTGTFPVSYDRFSNILPGEPAIACVKDGKLLYYESNREDTFLFPREITDRYPFYHAIKSGPTVDMYCELPTKGIVIFSYESIPLDFSEVSTVIDEMNHDLEEFISLTSRDGSVLEVVSIEHGFDVILRDSEGNANALIDDLEVVKSLVGEWFEGVLDPSKYRFVKDE